MSHLAFILLVLIVIWRRMSKESMRDNFEKLLDEGESVDEFALWAFGSGYESKRSEQLKDAWNELHMPDMYLGEDSLIVRTAAMMISLWRVSKHESA